MVAADGRPHALEEEGSMRTIVLSLALASLAATAAQAQVERRTCGPNWMGGYVCTTETYRESTVGSGDGKLSREERAEADKRSAKWEAYCQPKVVQGTDGIDRYQYAKAGCEFGKSGP
jgi:hypothetical protein